MTNVFLDACEINMTIVGYTYCKCVSVFNVKPCIGLRYTLYFNLYIHTNNIGRLWVNIFSKSITQKLGLVYITLFNLASH